MKKPFKILICLFAFLSLLPLCGCKSAKVEGTYATTSLSAMGLSATQKSFSSYSENRTETDKNHNTLYKPMQLLFDTQLVLNENKTASLTIFGFESTLNGDSHYSSVVDEAKSKGYVKNGNLVIENLKWSKDNSQKDTYFVYAVDENDKKMNLSEIWGEKLFSADHIHARIQNDKLACKIKVCIYEKDDEEKSSVALTTNVTIIMDK